MKAIALRSHILTKKYQHDIFSYVSFANKLNRKSYSGNYTNDRIRPIPDVQHLYFDRRTRVTFFLRICFCLSSSCY